MISAKTKVCCLIGDPVEHSLSPIMFNSAFKEMGIDCAYLAFRVLRSELGTAIAGIRGLSFVGSNVTTPHKEETLKYLDRLDPSAGLSGSVNVIHNVDGELVGYSTDGYGAIKALEEGGISIGGMRIMVLGYGGAARSVSFELARDGRAGGILIAGRDMIKASALANGISSFMRAEAITLKEGEKAGADLIINCTPVGMRPNTDESPLPPEALVGATAVMDLIYSPRETAFLRSAKAKGCKTIGGIEMLIHQGAKAFKIWFGKKAPIGVMRRAIEGDGN